MIWDAGVVEAELGAELGVSWGVLLGEMQIASPLLDTERMGPSPEALATELPGSEVNGIGAVPGRIVPSLGNDVIPFDPYCHFKLIVSRRC